LAYSKISKDVVLSSAISIIEIWDKKLYEEAIDGAIGGFAELAEQVMGGLNNGEDELS